MTDLTITLTGEIQASNFEEWKKDLIQQIKATPTELSSDQDFAAASKQVKQFKAAENALKKAKKSALEQAGEIQALFSAIDEVSAETREIRLTLDRQIKSRKKQIKKDSISNGLKTIKAMLASQSKDFQLIDASEYLDTTAIEEAVKGRSSLSSMEKAVAKVTAQVADQIKDRAALVAKNANTLDQLDATQQAMFQDRDDLLALTEDELKTTIEERQKAAGKATKKSAAPAKETKSSDELDIEFDMDGVTEDSETKSQFSLTIQLSCSKEQAETIKKEVQDLLKDNEALESIELA